jgi:glyoxylase-like metal-dependent hydrolase (beta-lactamase superfamily II)
MILAELPDIVIRRRAVGGMDNNVYLLTARGSGHQVLIDAADDPAAIGELLAGAARDTSFEPRLQLVVTTHSHWDHVRALGGVVHSTGARTAAGAADVPDIAVPTDVALKHGDVQSVDGFELEVIHLRGHTPGSVALLYRGQKGPAHLFTGDSLFPGGLGNTQGDPARFASLYADITERVFDRLPDDTLVHPGHGRGTTLGAERPSLGEWRARGW